MEDNTDRHATDGPMQYLQTSPAGDVDSGTGEAGDLFSHTVDYCSRYAAARLPHSTRDLLSSS